MNETDFYFAGESLSKLPYPAVLLDESTLPPTDLDTKIILNYPLRPDSAIDYAAFDPIETTVQETGPNAM